MKIDVQLQTNTGFSSNMTVFLKSRYNRQFTCCDDMDFPSKKIELLPVMFETIKIPIPDAVYVNGLKLIIKNGVSIVLDNITGIIQQSSRTPFLSISTYLFLISFSLFC